MDEAAAEKIARNNASFREANERIASAAAGHGFNGDDPVPFLCECSDRRCTTIILLTLAEYGRVRSDSTWFAHAPGHETRVPGAVEPVEETERYALVRKIGAAREALRSESTA